MQWMRIEEWNSWEKFPWTHSGISIYWLNLMNASNIYSCVIFVFLFELGAHYIIRRPDISNMPLKTSNSENWIIICIAQAVVQLDLVGLAMVHDHRIILSKNFVVFLLLADVDLFSVGECIREMLLLITSLPAGKHISLHLLKWLWQRVREFQYRSLVLGTKCCLPHHTFHCFLFI